MIDKKTEKNTAEWNVKDNSGLEKRYIEESSSWSENGIERLTNSIQNHRLKPCR